jgi:hypothetical protein
MEAQQRGLRGVAFLLSALLAAAVVAALIVLLALNELFCGRLEWGGRAEARA